MTIYRFSLRHLEEGEVTEVALPKNATLVHSAIQHGRICLWARLDEEKEFSTTRRFQVVGTGHPIRPEWKYVGTVHDPPFVWHVMETTS